MSNQADTERIQTPPSEEDPGFDDYTIAMLPTPQEHRFCHHGQLSAHWDVNEGNVHVTVPDLTVGLTMQFVTLSGIYYLELNRFDAISCYRNWASDHSPTTSQKKLLSKYFAYILKQWKDEVIPPRIDPRNPQGKQPQGPPAPSSSQMDVEAGPSQEPLVLRIPKVPNNIPQQHWNQYIPPDHLIPWSRPFHMSSPYSLHPNSAFAAPPPPPPMVSDMHMPPRMATLMPPPPPPPSLMRPPPMDPRTVRPIEIVPQVHVIPHKVSQPRDIPRPRAGTPYPIVRGLLGENKDEKALPKQAPAVLTTINEGPSN